MTALLAGAIAGAVIGGGTSAIGISNQNKNLIKAYKQRMKYLQMGYNHNQANLDISMRSARDSAIADLFNIQVNALNNQGLVTATLNESGVEGRGYHKTHQVMRGQNKRQLAGVVANFENTFYEGMAKKYNLHISTVAEMTQQAMALNQSFTKGAAAGLKIIGGAVAGAKMGILGAGALGAFKTASMVPEQVENVGLGLSDEEAAFQRLTIEATPKFSAKAGILGALEYINGAKWYNPSVNRI